LVICGHYVYLLVHDDTDGTAQQALTENDGMQVRRDISWLETAGIATGVNSKGSKFKDEASEQHRFKWFGGRMCACENAVRDVLNGTFGALD
jgi:hypothetical protein